MSRVVKPSVAVSAPASVAAGPFVWVHAYVKGPLPLACAGTVTEVPYPAVS